MTISLSLTQARDAASLARAVCAALTAAGETDLARKAAAVQGRDPQEYMIAVLALRADLAVEWQEAAR